MLIERVNMKFILPVLMFSLSGFTACAQAPDKSYIKIERMIPMRDGIRLFTAIYYPNKTSGSFPFLMVRTPYSCKPYGEENRRARLGPSRLFDNEDYIYVF